MLCLLWIHFIADFVLQSDKMALSKSKSLKWLTIHSAIYGGWFIIFGWQVALFLFASHWVVDFVSSRLNAKFYAAGNRRAFFLTIGADQFVHLALLVLAAPWMY